MASDAPDTPEILPLPKPGRPGDSSLLSSSPSYRSARRELLKLLAENSDVLEHIDLFRPGEAGSTFRVVFPPGVLEALQRGDLHFIKAKDQLGHLPVLSNGDGFARQVRIAPERLRTLDPEALANAVSHARTHALLQRVLVALDAIERKVDAVLINQQIEWRARIAAGVTQLKEVERDPGDAQMRAPFLANALQSLVEGRQAGLLQLKEHVRTQVRPQREWWRQILSGMKLHAPSEHQAAVLDRVRDDFGWLYVAAIATSRIHDLSGRETLAREALPQLARDVAELLDECADRYPFAQYSREREDFWKLRVVALRALSEPHAVSIALEFEAHEVNELRPEDERRDR